MDNLWQILLVIATGVGLWKSFEKAGRQGWEGIVPFYNFYVLTIMIGRPVWWIVLFILPIVNIIPNMEVAKRYGQPDVFGIGLALLGPVFWCLLGFGDSDYLGDAEMKP